MRGRIDPETLEMISELLALLADFAAHPTPIKIPLILSKIAKIAKKVK